MELQLAHGRGWPLAAQRGHHPQSHRWRLPAVQPEGAPASSQVPDWWNDVRGTFSQQSSRLSGSWKAWSERLKAQGWKAPQFPGEGARLVREYKLVLVLSLVNF